MTEISTSERVDHSAAITSRTEVVMESGRSAAEWYALGDAARKENEIVEAHRAYTAALVADPGHANARYRLGEIAFLADDHDAAEKFFRDTLVADPTHASARSELNKLLAKQAMRPIPAPSRPQETRPAAGAPSSPAAEGPITEWGIPASDPERERYAEHSREKARIDWMNDHWYAYPVLYRVISILVLLVLLGWMAMAVYQVATMP